MTSELFFAMLFGLAVQFALIYGAIRMALVHDRALQVREVKAGTAKAAWKAQSEEARAAARKS